MEDCDFQYTADKPSISFEVSPRKIIVESNQDGFIERDVTHICHTGRSWKRQTQGYIGDKGIGFKSVFGVASQVEIQSNAFSFFFKYNGGTAAEDRLGMITPIIGDRPIMPNERPLTRMTLTLNGRRAYDNLVSDFTAIPKTLLLFLSKLKEIRFRVHSEDRHTISMTTFGVSDEGGGIVHITADGSFGPQQSRYHVVRTPILGLPNDSARPDINGCETVLAFPIDDNGSPARREHYDIYAFLPVCTVGFNVCFV